jgi:hypothetical protein
MPRFRVYLTPPDGATPLQSFHMTEKQARDFLKLLLDAGQPKGTRYKIYKTIETEIEKGEC